MNKPLSNLILVIALATSGALQAEEPKLAPIQFDRDTPPASELYFVHDAASLKPNLSVFEIENERFLSSDKGERYALATFRNTSSVVSINEKDVVGILANGKRLNPISIEGESRIHDLGTVLLHFGPQKFPLVKIETRN